MEVEMARRFRAGAHVPNHGGRKLYSTGKGNRVRCYPNPHANASWVWRDPLTTGTILWLWTHSDHNGDFYTNGTKLQAGYPVLRLQETVMGPDRWSPSEEEQEERRGEAEGRREGSHTTERSFNEAASRSHDDAEGESSEARYQRYPRDGLDDVSDLSYGKNSITIALTLHPRMSVLAATKAEMDVADVAKVVPTRAGRGVKLKVNRDYLTEKKQL